MALKRAIGFLLIPVFAVLFARVVAVYYGDSGSDARRVVTQETARQLILALDAFRSVHHRLPTANEGLGGLSPEHLEGVPVDGWGRPFAYAPSVDNMWADIVSYGADGELGGNGDAADISGRFGSLSLRPPAFVDVVAEMLFFAVVLLGFFGSGRSAWAAGMLSGTAAFCAMLLFAVITGSPELSSMAIIAPAVALVCLTGSVAVLRQTPGASVVTSVAVLSAYVLLGKLIAV